MLGSMVTACASWMRAGLPLKVLKLVIFSKSCDVNQLSVDDKKALEKFQQLKEYLCSLKHTEVLYMTTDKTYVIYNSDSFQTTEITHDLYFSFDVGDAGFVDGILKHLNGIRKNLRIIRNGIVPKKHTEETSLVRNDNKNDADSGENLDPLEKHRIQLSR